MGVTFTAKGAERIRNVVRRVEGMPQSVGTERNQHTPQGTEFWAMVMGCDVTGLRHSIIAVTPNLGDDEPDFVLDSEIKFDFVKPLVLHQDAAREVNNTRGVGPGVIVKVTFAGYRNDGEPVYIFAYTPPMDYTAVPPHDHRDNFSGGFAYGVYHPGTGIPQMPWST